jgi:hypothetical protein
MSERNRRILRAGLIVAAIPAIQLGIWATLAPRSFYDDFPGAGHAWVSPSGPFNEHLVRDVGAFNLGLLVVYVFAFVTMERRLLQAAFLAAAVAGTPHLIFHLTDTESLSTADNVASLTGLVLVVAVPLAMLPLTRGQERVAAG